MNVYRVVFAGERLSDEARDALTTVGATWEGSGEQSEGRWRHRALVSAATERDAVSAVQAAMQPQGGFGDFEASPVRDARGRPWQAPACRVWDEIDWEISGRASLSRAERDVIWVLLDAAEPTGIIAEDLDDRLARDQVVATLEHLQRQGLVRSTIEETGATSGERAPECWWTLSDQAWDLLGLVKSPTYK